MWHIILIITVCNFSLIVFAVAGRLILDLLQIAVMCILSLIYSILSSVGLRFPILIRPIKGSVAWQEEQRRKGHYDRP